jgi:membrane protein
MKEQVQRVLTFVRRDIWRMRMADLATGRAFLLKQLRMFVLAVRGFAADQCPLRAAALTFYSVLSIVPVIAMLFGIAKGFGMERLIRDKLPALMEGQEEVAKWIIEFAERFLERARGGVVAGVGVVILLWTVIKVLGNVEKAFNHVWGVAKGRSLLRKFTDYISVLLVCPILLAVSHGATAAVNTELRKLVAGVGVLGPALVALMSILPFCLLWAVFSFVYAFVPNTRVRLRSAIVAGVIAGTTFQVATTLFVKFQVGVSKYSAVYGSFAALPLFLIWMQLSWLIVLFGAELSFAHQNAETYEFEPDAKAASHAFKRLVALRLSQVVVRDFADGAPPKTGEQLAHEVGIPVRLAREALAELVRAGVLLETRDEDVREPGYAPARSLEMLTVGYVLQRLEREGEDTMPLEETDEVKELSGCLEEFAERIRTAPANVLLRNVGAGSK